MKFMVMVRATTDSEAGRMPTREQFAEMGRFNEELVKAGVMQAGEGLHPSAKGARVRFAGADRQVVPGPFPVDGLVAGFWLWECASLEAAIDWVKRCPNPMPGDSDIEIRQLYAAEDFGEAFPPDLQAREDRLRAEIDERSAGGAAGAVGS